MNCSKCQNPIDQGRIDWCNKNGYTCKYCKACSDANKAAKAQGGAAPAPGGEKPDWDKISFGKIAHGFLTEAYKIEKAKGTQQDPEAIKKAKNDAFLWTNAELEVQALIDNNRKLQ